MKISKKARLVVFLFLAALFAFYDDCDHEEWKRVLTEKESSDGPHDATIVFPFDKMNGLAIVLPSAVDTTPQKIITDLVSNPEAVIDERHRKCKATTQVKISFETTDTNKPVMLSTFDENGVEKKEGGDEFYITYSASTEVNSNVPDVVAHVKDLHNGQYMLELVQPLLPFEVQRLEEDILPGGILTVVLQYTCGFGSYMPPTKETWDHGGAINRQWHAQVPQDFLPPIVKARDRPMPQSFRKELASYRAIYAIGDSLMRQFTGMYHPDLYKLNALRRDNIGQVNSYGGAVLGARASLKSSTLDKFIGLAKKLVRDQGIEGDKGSDYAIWLGSGVWDLLDNNHDEQPNFDDHLKALRELIGIMKGLTNAKLYWKSMTGVHVHIAHGANIKDDFAVERMSYCSTSRAKMLYDAQMKLMKELDIPVFDMYNFTFEAADQTLPGDARHFNGELNEMMMDYFYPVRKPIANGLNSTDSNYVQEERY